MWLFGQGLASRLDHLQDGANSDYYSLTTFGAALTLGGRTLRQVESDLKPDILEPKLIVPPMDEVGS